MSGDKSIFLFANTRKVVLAEKRAIALKIPYQIIPIPKEFSSECGMCIEIDSSNNNIFSSDLYKFNIMHKIVKEKNDE